VRDRKAMTKPYVYGHPVPEAIAGALMGLQMTLGIAFVRPMAYLVEDPAIAPFVLAVGAVLGFIVSWFMAARALRHMRAERISMAQSITQRRAA